MIHLQVHSEYSLLDGCTSIDNLISLAKANNMDSLALTDNGVMFGAMDFYLKAKKAGIKPIIGCEMYVVNSLEDEVPNWLRFILLCKDYVGYQNLSKMVSKANIDGLELKPRVTIADLEANTEGLIAIYSDKKLDMAISKISSLYGDDFFVGISRVGTPSEEGDNVDILCWNTSWIGAPVVALNNIYFSTKQDARLRDVVYCIQKNKRVDFDMPVETDQTYFKSQEEMKELFKDIPEAIDNTGMIAKECNVEIPIGKVLMPEFDCPDGLSPEEYLRELTYKGLAERYCSITQEIRDRADFELKTINDMGFPIYFLIVWDFVLNSRKRGIPVGPGRGSAGGSIVAYALDITRLDPLSYNLLFERFLNPERVSMPDIDLDFCIKRREEVFSYLTDKYGEDRVSHIGTFGTLASRAVIRDVGRALGVPLGTTDKIAKLITQKTVQGAINDLPELQKMYRSSPLVKKLLVICNKLEGNARHVSVHAAGVLISRDPLSSIVPLQKSGDNIISQYAMKELDKMGLLKMDILGLRNLTVIQDCLEKIKANQGIDLDLYKIALDDEKTFDLLRKGMTSGVFQLESDGMKKLIIKLVPERFEDIIALLALYRPGPLGSKMDRTFVANKKKPSKIVYDVPELEPVLEDTYGVILYQEQVMKISSVVGGFSLAQADMLRRAMGKKDQDEMDKMKALFVEGAIGLGFEKEVSESVFAKMQKFAEYGFNKCFSGDCIIDRVSKNSQKPLTIEEMYKIKNDKSYAKSAGHIQLHRKYNRDGYGKAYSLNENSRLIPNGIKDIYFQGTREVYLIHLENGNVIKSTSNHKFPVVCSDGVIVEARVDQIGVGNSLMYNAGYEGYQKKGQSCQIYKKTYTGHGFQAGKLNVAYTDGEFFKLKENKLKLAQASNGCCKDCDCLTKRAEFHHVVPVDMGGSNDIENLIMLCPSCHKKRHYQLGRTKKGQKGLSVGVSEISLITHMGFEDVYDVEMESPYHTLSVNGIVASNSHSACYALISYQTAYLKANYPVEYMTALLSSTLSSLDKTALYVQECKEMGLTILGPDVNKSIGDFSIEGDAIRFGILAIKGIGEGPVEAIIESRVDGPHSSLFDFVLKIDTKQINKGAVESLIKSGSFDNISDRSLLLATYELVLKRAHALQKQSEKEGFKLEGNPGQQLDIDMEAIISEGYREYTNVEKLNFEKEVTGLYMSGSILDDYRGELAGMDYDTSKIVDDCDSCTISLIGSLTNCKTTKTKMGKDMCMADLTDLVGTIRILFFPNYYTKDIVPLFKDGNVVLMNGNVKISDKDKVIFVNKMQLI